ncbi:MAG: GNAT family N-acetyltransferase [Candidatus Berkiella sp.]
MNSLKLISLETKMETAFLAMTNASCDLHAPWVSPPLEHKDFVAFYERYQQDNQKSYVVFKEEKIVGVFNISEIVRGYFQSAYLGFYVAKSFQGQGYMRQGLQLLLQEAFTNLNLHRLEANVQPNNMRSIKLIKQGGFRKEGYSPRYLKINEEWRDHERWAITVEDWRHHKENRNENTQSG